MDDGFESQIATLDQRLVETEKQAKSLLTRVRAMRTKTTVGEFAQIASLFEADQRRRAKACPEPVHRAEDASLGRRSSTRARQPTVSLGGDRAVTAVSRHDARVAIEALRAGAPNRAAIRMLGTVETAIEDRFITALDAMWSEQPMLGQWFAGGFGTGKSHLLGTLREQALRRNVVVSWVTVSKETPLSQPGLVFAAAMRNAVVPGQPDDADNG